MTDTEHEHTHDELEAETVTDTEPEPEPEPDEPDDEEEELAADESPDESPDTASIIADQDKQLERLQRHVSKRLGEILGEMATDYNPCPVCTFYGTPGWMLGTSFSPEQQVILQQIMGMRSPADFKADAYSAQCLVCAGLGEVSTGSRVPGFETAMCLDCDGKGWIATDEKRRRIPVVGPNGGAGLGLAPVPLRAGPADAAADEPPEAAELRSKGYLVMAPPTLSG